MGYKIITINREFESGGSEIAQAVAQKLHIPYIDRFLVTEAAQQGGFSMERMEATDERLASRFEYSQVAAAKYYGGMDVHFTANEQVAKVQFQLIKELAESGPCVIVGRCANYLLRDRDDVLDVFIHAGFDYRLKRTIEKLGLPENKAEKVLKQADKGRKEYYSYYTGMDWEDPDSYHLVLNSDKLDFDLCVELICDLYSK